MTSKRALLLKSPYNYLKLQVFNIINKLATADLRAPVNSIINNQVKKRIDFRRELYTSKSVRAYSE